MTSYFGKIKFFNLKNKFGFIRQSNTENDYYFYIKDPVEELNTNDVVSFELKESKKGIEAINVKKV
ncbi:MAG: cold shock domain-containing protein [Bacteroidetes bacterium]|nr:cold shock domain-containing protein [Bacteroidota bacterium]